MNKISQEAKDCVQAMFSIDDVDGYIGVKDCENLVQDAIDKAKVNLQKENDELKQEITRQRNKDVEIAEAQINRAITGEGHPTIFRSVVELLISGLRKDREDLEKKNASLREALEEHAVISQKTYKNGVGTTFDGFRCLICQKLTDLGNAKVEHNSNCLLTTLEN